jgi:probable HAF family extracellular repeat protein
MHAMLSLSNSSPLFETMLEDVMNRFLEFSRTAILFRVLGLIALVSLCVAAFTQVPDYVRIDLGYIGATPHAINGQNAVVGELYNKDTRCSHAFLWKDGALTDLGTLGGLNSYAQAINDSDHVVGWSQTTDGKVHAFLWKDGVMSDLGTLGGDSSYAMAINEHNQVVGNSDTRNGTTHAFLWQGGGMTDIHPVEADSFADSHANDINNAGEIIADYWGDLCLFKDGSWQNLGHGDAPFGWAHTMNSVAISDRGFIAANWWYFFEDYRETQSFTHVYESPVQIKNGLINYLIGTWPPDLCSDYSSIVMSMNDAGVMVGSGGPYTNWLYQDESFWNISDLVVSEGQKYISLDSINNSGIIAGHYYSGSDTCPVLLVPVPNTINVTITNITPSSAKITWKTAYPSNSVVRYGKTVRYGSTKTDESMVTSHSVTLTSLSSVTAYHFQVSSTDSNGVNGISGDYTFVTPSAITSGGDGYYSATITRLWDGRYKVDGSYTYGLIDGVTEPMLETKLVSASVGSATLYDTIELGTFYRNQTKTWSQVFPKSAGAPGTTVVVRYKMEWRLNPYHIGRTYGSFRVILP